ncbi:MAG: 4-hydroxyphenylacetate 3-hydroxylase family protein [Peptococcaceae bacterium]|jgi:4-hydroxybutyryl-CoA dehydratase/vinylacetyl-CoA-Delta-isomerase|nr:4-hydroxyphenylacetate 3-hydroxylase family protein [Peptococcaceae bacterium]MDH7525380.1 4-hydroxyphenylacetate 3-hydroxylase family protein [Peptococcaceae bacterium]
MMTGREYIESLKELKPRVYYQGVLINSVVGHPAIQPHINSAAVTYDAANEPAFEDLGVTISHITGKRINRFTHIHQTPDDLVKKVKLLRMIGQNTGSCFQRCVGFDALNALYSTTYDMDCKLATIYHKRFLEYLVNVQEKDLMIAGAMTDPKGDRSLRPGQQADPDLFVRVVDKNDQGIVIRGAKCHMTGMVNSHEMLIMPTTALTEEDKDYAVSCAVPVDAPGVLHIFGRQTNDDRKLDSIDQGNFKFGAVGGECLTVLEDVFVPWEKVFMCGEYQFAGILVERFASFHRQNYGACKVGLSDVIIGASALLAEYNGVAKAAHIKDKIIEMIQLSETLYCCSLACSGEGRKLPSGACYVDPLLANVVKQNITRYIYEICRLSHDIAGGFIATLPSEKDLRHPELGKYVEKYFKGVAGVPAEKRYRLARLVENMTGGTALVESMHGAGSPQAQRVMLARQANLEHKKQLAKKLVDIEE